MSSFEYVMVLISIIIGLAIAHVLNALAVAVHRLRGHGDPIKLDIVYLLWIAYIMTWLMAFWWWEFKLQDVYSEWSFGLYLFVISYATALFLTATILVPYRMLGVKESFQYFMAGRKWFFGALIVLQVLDIIDSFLKSYDWAMRPEYLIQSAVYFLAPVIGMIFQKRVIHIISAASAVTVQFVFLFRDLGVLGSW